LKDPYLSNYGDVLQVGEINMKHTEATSQLFPFVTVAYAQTLDGRIATSVGQSYYISSPESLRFTHELRANHDAIMVGIGTVCQDNPRLTVRLVNGKDPLRVVVDSSLRILLDAAVLAAGAATGTVLAVTEQAPMDRREAARSLGATVFALPNDGCGGVDLRSLLGTLYEYGIRSLMVEGGSRLITSLIRAELVDRMVVDIAPKLIGSGVEAIRDLGITDLSQAIRLSEMKVMRLGDDLIIDSRVSYPVRNPLTDSPKKTPP
jgi:diaminohydroxyphosphoribosylaminopyrimidine deaminase / 5-amino-6-(5-phosphoribosylamino)uracil reductase